VTRMGDDIRVTTTRGSVDAHGVIIAANAWISRLVPAMRDFIVPVRGQMASFAPIEAVFTHGMGAAVTDTEEYWQQTPDGTILIGGCRATHPTRDEGTLEDAVTADVQMELEDVLPRLLPALTGKLHVMRRWSGPMAFTPDRLPVVDRVTDVSNAWFAGGFCGHGMPFGLVLGKVLAEQITNSGVTTPPSMQHGGRRPYPPTADDRYRHTSFVPADSGHRSGSVALDQSAC